MDKIKCPACGAEMNAGLENCPSCGAPVGAMKDQDTSGTPIDNKEAIDSMLEKANLLVEEGKALGIEGLEDEPEPQVNGYGEEEVPGGNNGGDGNNAPNNPDESLIVENDPGVTLFEMDEDGNIISDEKEDEPKKDKKEKKQRAKKDRRNGSGGDDRDNGNKNKKGKTSKGAVIAAAVIFLAIGAAAGFFGKMLLFPDFPAPSCQSFAEKAVNAVNSVLGSDEEIYVAESYVKEFTSSTQCLIRTFYANSDTVSEKWYRVKVDSSESKKIKVYTQYDEETLNDMFNSSNDEDRAKAAVLSGIQEETDRLINDMRGGNDWVEVNPILLNSSIHPYRLP